MAIRAIPFEFAFNTDREFGEQLEITAKNFNNYFESLSPEAKVKYLGHITLHTDGGLMNPVHESGALLLVETETPELLPQIEVPEEKPFIQGE